MTYCRDRVRDLVQQFVQGRVWNRLGTYHYWRDVANRGVWRSVWATVANPVKCLSIQRLPK